MKIATSTLALISLATSVHGHGYVASPPACYKENVMKTNYAARITPDINPAFANGKWNGTPQENIATSTLALISLATSVHGHGYVANPPGCYNKNVMKTNYAARITPDINPAFADGKWNGTPQENVALFHERFPETGYKDIIPGCGNSRESCDVQDVSGLTELIRDNSFAHGKVSREGFPVDYSIYQGQCMLRFYWLGRYRGEVVGLQALCSD
ncbi:hypothetical protein PsorP6_014166 [Peronosclerospora sorghi]|uniref:Uncharacterized protein n=1 Tax=Peronosclerospora sorghi TaxID=230839 RepID=A0ACC0VFY5_9STRA|nr:hypothetical protein PsorP6_014166 [Peronosclerospora sorghi]